jgi:cytochrome d ubiquinol oxidase subunit II
MIASIAPFWDGNETWLVLGGAGLLVAFPQAYAVIMPALYLPVIVMLLALVFRGVAFEFRHVAQTSKRYWNFAFMAGSTLAGFCQGVILGGLVQGIRVENGVYAGGAFDWATPFAALCGLGVLAGYGLLGATWLVMKTEGAVATRARRQAKLFLLAVLGFMGAVSLWTPLAHERIAVRWFSTPNIYYLWPVPFVTALTAFAAWRWLDSGRDVLPFFAAIGLFLLGYLGLVISVFPYLVPPHRARRSCWSAP